LRASPGGQQKGRLLQPKPILAEALHQHP